MEKLRNYVKTALIYFIGNVFSKVVAFFLLPLYTNYLPPKIMGEFDYATTILGFVAPICFFQIWDAMFRFSFDDDKEKFKQKVVSNSFFAMIVGIIIFSIIFIVLQNRVCFQYVILVYLYGIMIAINYLYSYLTRVYRNNFLFSISGFVNSFVVAICNIVLIIRFNMGLESLYISVIVGAVVQCLMIEIVLRPLSFISLKFFDKILLTEMVKFSFPLCIATISYWLLSGYTKVVIVQFLGVEDNGLYAVTNKFASLINMVVSIFQFAWNEMAYIYNKDDNRINMYSTAIKYVIHYVIIASCGLMIVSKLFFPYMVGKSYQSAIEYLPAAILGVSFNAIAGFIGTIFSAEKKTRYIFGSTVLAAIMNIVLSVYMTKRYALQGAMIALAISFVTLLLIRIWYARRAIGITVEKKFIKNGILLLVTIIIFYLNTNNMLSIIYILVIIGMELWENKELYKKILLVIGRK